MLTPRLSTWILIHRLWRASLIRSCRKQSAKLGKRFWRRKPTSGFFLILMATGLSFLTKKGSLSAEMEFFGSSLKSSRAPASRIFIRDFLFLRRDLYFSWMGESFCTKSSARSDLNSPYFLSLYFDSSFEMVSPEKAL